MFSSKWSVFLKGGAIGIADRIFFPLRKDYCVSSSLVQYPRPLPIKMPAMLSGHGDHQNIPRHFQKSPSQQKYGLQLETTDPESLLETE